MRLALAHSQDGRAGLQGTGRVNAAAHPLADDFVNLYLGFVACAPRWHVRMLYFRMAISQEHRSTSRKFR